jgi:hypothetical protein
MIGEPVVAEDANNQALRHFGVRSGSHVEDVYGLQRNDRGDPISRATAIQVEIRVK